MSWIDKAKTERPTTPPPKLSSTHINLRGHLLKAGLGEIADDLGYLATSAQVVLDKWITEDPAMEQLKKLIIELSEYDQSVLIFGETGTGKEMLARALHGDRLGKFVAINCAAMPSELLESELFGHVKGSFTGATSDKRGLLAEAEDGTMFLDEIGDMPVPMQAKLLRVIQERSIRPVGSTVTIPIKCRFVCATHRNIDQIELNNYTEVPFRADLYWRIAAFTVRITPLRLRTCDIIALIHGKYDTEGMLSDEEIDAIASLPLYGNCRELEARVNRLLLQKSFELKRVQS